MNTLLKIALLAGSSASVIALPVSAGNHVAELRGMSNPYAAIAEFEGGHSAQASHNMIWQQAHQTTAKPRYASSRFAPSSSSSSHGMTAPRFSAPQSYAMPSAKMRSRKFGYGNVYDYESGHCGQACAAPMPRPMPQYRTYTAPVQPVQTYRQITQYKCWDGEIVSTNDGCKRQTITKTIPQFRCWDGEIVTDENGCKRQTITREVMSTRSSGSISTPVNCPSGTTAQADGTCLESSSMPMTSYDSGFSSYNSQPSFSSMPTNCPSGTTAQSDGTCMEGGSSGYTSPYAGSSIDLFRDYSSGDSYGSANSYNSSSYLPIRK